MVKVGMPNEGEISISKKIVANWKPTKISHVGETVFFVVDKIYLSMKEKDFKEIFQKN